MPTISTRLVRNAALCALTASVCTAPSHAQEGAPTMKAVRISAFGGTEVLHYEDVPRPVAREGEILVRVRAAGVNPVDWKIRQRGFGRPVSADAPMILGFDVSGVVEAVGEGVTSFKRGDEVFAYLPLATGGGYAQYVAVAEAHAAHKPDNLDHTHAAGVPLAALTAWQALVETAGLEAGQTVLIHAGAGGVGHFAVQIAKARGARVIATASERNHDFLRQLGADEVIDYRAQRFEEAVKGADVVLDAVGGDTLTRSFAVLKPGGFLVTIAGSPSRDLAQQHNVRAAGILVRPDGAQLATLAAMIEAGEIVPHVSVTLPLEQVAKAHEMSESGRTRGKIVLIVP